MGMHSQSYVRAYKGSAAITAYTIVKFGAADDTVSPAAAATDLLIGVANELGLSASDQAQGATLDVIQAGPAEVVLGGTVTRGQKLTANSSAQAVAAAPAAGSNVQVIGIAMKSGVSGDIIPVLVAPSVMQG
jgi:hypothetical protein